MSEQLRQGDLVTLDGEAHVVVSRTCDLVESRNGDAVAHVAQIETDGDQRAQKGWNPRLVRIPGATGSLADMTTVTPVLLEGLREKFLAHGCRNEDEARTFRREVGRWLSMSSLPDDVHRSLRKLTKHIKEKVEYDVLGALLDQVAQVRVRLQPLRSGGLEMQVVFVTRSDFTDGPLPDGSVLAPDMVKVREAAVSLAAKGGGSIGDRAGLVVSYCDVLASKIEPAGLVEDVSHEVASPHELVVADYLATEPLDLDLLSLDDLAE